jgi:hypothetical protein
MFVVRCANRGGAVGTILAPWNVAKTADVHRCRPVDRELSEQFLHHGRQRLTLPRRQARKDLRKDALALGEHIAFESLSCRSKANANGTAVFASRSNREARRYEAIDEPNRR